MRLHHLNDNVASICVRCFILDCFLTLHFCNLLIRVERQEERRKQLENWTKDTDSY
uniref:Uncharacterized protein n=1 Tax=Rhizophora mucronata TaxID=61149 RepID=A0A2P2QK69_RHIMU